MRELHRELAVLRQRADLVVRVEAGDAVDERDVACGHDALAVLVEADRVGLVVLDLEQRLLEVEDDVGDILDDAGERGELVQRAFDRDVRDRRALQRRQQNPAQRDAERRAEAALERLARELAVGVAALFDFQRARPDQVAPVLRHERSLLGGRFHLSLSLVGAFITADGCRRGFSRPAARSEIAYYFE